MIRSWAPGIIFETATATFSVGYTYTTVSLSAPHKRIPTVNAIPQNSTNANYNVSVSSATTEQVVLEISSPAPADLVVHIHAASYL